MKLRYYASIMTGAFSANFTMFILWVRTNMQIHNIIAWSLIAYITSVTIVLMVTEPKKKARKEPKFITLSPEYYYKLEETDESKAC